MRKTLAAAAFLPLVLFSGPPATAAPAQHYNYDECMTYESFTYCFAARGVYQSTLTPSGVYVSHGKGAGTWAVYDETGNLQYKTTFEDKSALVLRDWEVQVVKYEYAYAEEFGGATCHFTASYKQVQDKVLTNDYEFACDSGTA